VRAWTGARTEPNRRPNAAVLKGDHPPIDVIE
jgi:hypothetical protein